MAERIDLKFVKEQSDFLTVLAHYNLSPLGSGVSRTMLCPFHQEKKPSCKVNLGRKGFHCFGCEAKGNLIEFVRRMEGLPENDLRAAARKLAAICSIPLAPPRAAARAPKSAARRESEPETTEEPSGAETPHSGPGEPADELAVNEPLDPAFIERFEAKLVREHAYFSERGLTPELIRDFRLGYHPDEGRGIMRNRVVIPIFSWENQLLAYAGRWVGPDETIPEGKGKYELPKGFHKELELFNAHRLGTARHIIVVEGFFSVFRLHALGVPSVALMGHHLAARHVELCRQRGIERLTFLLDGDDAGRASVPAMMKLIAASPLRAKFAVLPEGTQPDTVEYPVLRELLSLR